MDSRAAAAAIACRWLQNNPNWNFGRFNTDVDPELYPLFDLEFPLPNDWDHDATTQVKNWLKEFKKGLWKDALTEMKKDSSQAGKATQALSKLITTNVNVNNVNNVIIGNGSVKLSQINGPTSNSGSKKRSRSETPPPAASSSKPSRRRGNEAERPAPNLETPIPAPECRPSTSTPIGRSASPFCPPLSLSQAMLGSGKALGVCNGVVDVCSGNNTTEPNTQLRIRKPSLELSCTSPNPSGIFREFDSIPPCCIGCTEHPPTRAASEQMSPPSPARPASEQLSFPLAGTLNTTCKCAVAVERLNSQMVEHGRKIELIIKLLSLQREADKTWSTLQCLTGDDPPA